MAHRAGLVVGLIAAACSTEPPALDPHLTPAEPPSIVLITLDTTRADHLGCYGYPRAVTPFLDELAEESAVFDAAYTTCSLTVAAHASLFTSLYPSQHRVLFNGYGLPATIPTLAEALGRAGYETAAFTSVNFLSVLSRGFEVFQDPGSDPALGPGSKPHPYRYGAEMVDAVLRWARRRDRTRPAFVWVHLFDPHRPHAAPAEVKALLHFEDGAERDRLRTHWTRVQRIPDDFFWSCELLEFNLQEYDAEMLFDDQQIRRLHAGLESASLGRDAAWIVTADHGEGLGNHHAYGHMVHVYREQAHIPLMIRLPGMTRGRRVAALVSMIDLGPTIAELAGSRLAGEGTSLLPLARGEEAAGRDFVFYQRRPPGGHESWDRTMYALQTQQWKYLYRSDSPDELYDIVSDPLEIDNVLPDHRIEGEHLEALAADMYRRLEVDGAQWEPGEVDPRLEKELRSLGYAQ